MSKFIALVILISCAAGTASAKCAIFKGSLDFEAAAHYGEDGTTLYRGLFGILPVAYIVGNEIKAGGIPLANSTDNVVAYTGGKQWLTVAFLVQGKYVAEDKWGFTTFAHRQTSAYQCTDQQLLLGAAALKVIGDL